VSIRLQLLIVALTTLILPWAGCQYARELESALRVSQEQALEASADTMAHALAAEPLRVFRNIEDSTAFAQDQGDIYVFPLRGQPLLDGYREDWDVPLEAKPLPGDRAHAARFLAGSTERYLFLYLEVDDPHFVAEPLNPHPEQDRFDRVNLSVERPDGSTATYFFATDAPGLIQAQAEVKGEDGVDRATGESRIQAFWLQTSRGYHLEARLPLSLVGARLWIQALDSVGGKSGFAPAEAPHGGRLFMTMPGLDTLLGTFISSGTRATVVDANGLKLGTAGSVGRGEVEEEVDTEGTWYRRFVTVDTSTWPLQVTSPERIDGSSVASALAGHPAADWLRSGSAQDLVLLAAAPLKVGDRVFGAVVLEQSGDQLIELRDRALAHLFNLTLLATALAVLFAFSVAAVISLRIERLRAAADGALGNDGRIRLDMPESGRADEIGALARGFERLLARLNEHTLYLRTLGGKLAHELRTPLTIVRSSLDNLESEGVRTDQREYLTRAQQGTLRLQSILSALGAAARVEESIKQAERVQFDLGGLVTSAVEGYRDAFPAAHFALDAPSDPCHARGAPDLMVQMLDKLIENAVDFCPPSGRIVVSLTRTGGNYELAVSNDGPPIPAELVERLFESLFEHRQGRDDKPHFGLGLYIVRLIAEFHGGAAHAANRADGGGATFTVVLPLI
jgi:two-component system, OmpR family, sensor histidine kinase ChvG